MNRVLMVGAAETTGDLAAFLSRSGCLVRRLDPAQPVLDRLHETDVLLLGMGSTGALEECRTIRVTSNVPLVALMVGDDEQDRIRALRAGADDCVPTTCGHGELLARMEAVLRRCRHWPSPAGDEQVVNHGALRVDLRNREVWLADRRVATTAKEFGLLRALVLRPTEVLSRKELMAGVWRCDAEVPSRTLDTHVSSLRAKLGSKRWIRNVRGIGYCLGSPEP